MNKKRQDWEFILLNAIYVTLIGYSIRNNEPIPFSERERMGDKILEKFKKDLSYHHHSEPKKINNETNS